MIDFNTKDAGFCYCGSNAYAMMNYGSLPDNLAGEDKFTQELLRPKLPICGMCGKPKSPADLERIRNATKPPSQSG